MTVVLVLLLGAALATAVIAGSGSSPADTASGGSASGGSGASTEPAKPGPSGQAAAPATQAPAAAGPTSVAFLGDGYTAPGPQGGQGQANYTAILAAKDNLKVTNESVFASGYVSAPALQTRLQKVLAGGPQVVVVTAGRADDQSSPQAVGAAATQLYQDLKTRLPQAKIVVIGPMWLEAQVPARGVAVRDAIRDAATAAKLPFVDPIAERWFNGQDADGISANKLVLNDKGHQRLAQLVDAALKRSGVLPG